MADLNSQVKVIALSDIRHGIGSEVTEYHEGDELTLTIAEAKPLLAIGVVKASDAVINAVNEASDETVATPAQPSQEDIAQTLGSVETQV